MGKVPDKMTVSGTGTGLGHPPEIIPTCEVILDPIGECGLPTGVT